MEGKLSAHMRARLRQDIVVWLATTGRSGRPHVVPVWFWWDGDTFLVYSIPGQKVKDLQAEPRVQLHLNSDPDGEDVVRFDAVADLGAKVAPTADKVPAYVRKYREQMKGYAWTPKQFAELYHIAIRFRPTRVH